MRSRSYRCSLVRRPTDHPGSARTPALFLVIALTAILAAAPSARADGGGFGFSGFDLRFGPSLPLEGEWDTGFLAGASVSFAEVSEGVFIFPSASYSRVSRSEGPVELTLTDYTFGLETRHFPAGEPRGWFYGGGPSIHLLDVELGSEGGSLSEAGTLEASSQEVGASFMLGYALGGGASGFNVEARGSYVSGFSSAQVLVGYRFGRWNPNPLE